MKPLALKAMSLAGLVLTTLSCNNLAFGEETLNFELLCEGKAEMTFEDPSMAKGYENVRKLFGDFAGLNLIFPGLDKSETFSERVSIQNNTAGKLKLGVSDTKIFISKETQIKVKEEGFEVTGDLDRLTGKFEIKILLSTELLDQVVKSDTLLSELGVNGVTLKGDCKKLDPKKKLF